MQDSLIRRILVVDDEADYRETICFLLQSLNYQSAEAGDGFSGLELLAEGEFDLVISDIKMPQQDGIQFMKEARSLHPEVEFIIMTGYSEEYSYSEIIASGASDFIEKPTDLGELTAKLNRIERERKLLQELRESNRSLTLEAEINSAVADVASALLNASSIEKISAMVLEHGKTLTNSRDGFVGYVDRDNAELVFPTVENALESNAPIREWTSTCRCVLEERRPLLVNVSQERGADTAEAALPTSVNRLISCPCLRGRDLMGVLTVINADHSYTERDLDLLSRLSTVYALACNRHWIEEDLRTTNRELEAEIAERKQLQSQLEEARRQLQELLEERTEKLKQAGKMLRCHIDRMKATAEIADETEENCGSLKSLT